MSHQPGDILVKDPDAAKFYTMNWHAWLPDGVEIQSSEWFITGPDSVLTKSSPEILDGARSTRVKIAAGTLGKRYRVTNRIVTDEAPNQSDDRSFTVLVQGQ